MIAVWLLFTTYIAGRAIGNITLYEKEQYTFWTTLISWLTIPALTLTNPLYLTTAVIGVVSWKTALLTLPLLTIFTSASFTLLLCGIASGIANTWLDIVDDFYIATSGFLTLLISLLV